MTTRIKTTHVGSLPRGEKLCTLLLARDRGEAADAAEFDRIVQDAVGDAVAEPDPVASFIKLDHVAQRRRVAVGEVRWPGRDTAQRLRHDAADVDATPRRQRQPRVLRQHDAAQIRVRQLSRPAGETEQR
jgi:hypothetical protein